MRFWSPLVAMVAIDGAVGVPDTTRQVSVEQTILLSPTFLSSLDGNFAPLANAVEDATSKTVDRVTVTRASRTGQRRLQSDGGVLINYYVSCDATDGVSCDSVISDLGSSASQVAHATAIIAAVTNIAAASGFVNAVVSSAEDVVASVAVPELVAITMREQLPGVLSSPSGASPANTRWRISNNSPIGDKWIISELQFFQNTECSVPTPYPVTVDWSPSPFTLACGTDSTACPLLTDGVCDNTPNQCCPEDGTQWGGPDTTGGRLAGGTWISFEYEEPVTVNCVQLCHAAWANQQVTDVSIQYHDGSDWVDFEIYYFDSETEDGGVQEGGLGDSQGLHSYNIGSTCDSAGMCPAGMFCNFDSGARRSHCEACSDCSECGECGLSAQGADDCSSSCAAAPVPPTSTMWKVSNNVALTDRWVISEIGLLSDSGAVINPLSMERSASSDGDRLCEDSSTCSILGNGVCNSGPAGQPDGVNLFPRWDQWAGGADEASQAPGGTFISFTFAEPVTPARLELCHAAVEHQQALEVLLQYHDGSTWVDYDVIMFSRYAEDRTTIIDGSDYFAMDTCGPNGIVCEPGYFCNFEVDGLTAGRCEPCSENCAAGCGTCRLPFMGLSDCSFMCAANDACPWTTPTDTANTFQCYDGSTCQGDGCCTDGVVKCPPERPVLCDKPFMCGDHTTNCCVADTESCVRGAPMECPGVISEAISVINGAYPAGLTYINFLAMVANSGANGR